MDDQFFGILFLLFFLGFQIDKKEMKRQSGDVVRMVGFEAEGTIWITPSSNR